MKTKQIKLYPTRPGIDTVTEVYINDIYFTNAAEFVTEDEDEKDIFIFKQCTHCFDKNCSSDWMTVKRAGDFVFILPAFHFFDDPRNSEFMVDNSRLIPLDEFNYLKELYLTKIQYEELRTVIVGLPKFESLSELTKNEVIRLIQIDSYSFLGKYPANPALSIQEYDSSYENLPELLESVEELVSSYFQSSETVKLKEMPRDCNTIFLADSYWDNQIIIFKVNNKFHLGIEPSFCIF